MSQIMKAYMGVFLLLLLTAVSEGIFTGYLQVLSAQDMHAAVIKEMENSHFYHEVVKECFEQAGEKGYRLEITMYKKDGTTQKITSGEAAPEDTKEVMGADVRMEFAYTNTFLQICQPRIRSGYAG